MAHPACLQYKICTAAKRLAEELSKNAEAIGQEILKSYHEVFVGVRIQPERAKKHKTLPSQVLPANIYEEDNNLIVQVEVGSIPKDKIELYATDEKLSITAMKQALPEVEGRLLSEEIPRGAIKKTINLPKNIDSSRVSASFEDGILTIKSRIRDSTTDSIKIL
jgi:HSP20 family molecular chaperone IbpA